MAPGNKPSAPLGQDLNNHICWELMTRKEIMGRCIGGWHLKKERKRISANKKKSFKHEQRGKHFSFLLGEILYSLDRSLISLWPG
jgi:hypothetical protein